MTALRARRPDLLLTNLIMPVKDGFILLKEIRADASLKNLKVLILSNLGEEEDKKKAFAMEVIEYIVKINIALNDIVEKVKQSAL